MTGRAPYELRHHWEVRHVGPYGTDYGVERFDTKAAAFEAIAKNYECTRYGCKVMRVARRVRTSG